MVTPPPLRPATVGSRSTGVPVLTTTRFAGNRAIVINRFAVIMSIDETGVEIDSNTATRFSRSELPAHGETQIDVEVRHSGGIAVVELVEHPET